MGLFGRKKNNEPKAETAIENKGDARLQKLLEELMQNAVALVEPGIGEVDTVFVIGLIEQGYFYKPFYKINGTLVKQHKINTVLHSHIDISNDQSFDMLRSGNELLARIEAEFSGSGKDVPTMLRLTYSPHSGKFDSEFGYDKTFSNHKTRTAQDVYENWYQEIENSGC